VILILHNRYRAAGGEERAVADLADLLGRRGHEVEVLERSSRGLSRRRAAEGMLSGGLRPEEIDHLVRARGARVVHAHNIHPTLGWRALAAARSAGARTVLHLHNYRLFCAIGIAYRDGSPCFRCRQGRTLPGLRLRCRGSVPEAAVYAVALHRQQPRLVEHVDRFVAVSDALAAHLRDLGLPASLTATLPNFLPDVDFASESHADAGEFVLAAGRLVEEKGFDTAIAAARAAGAPIVIAGEGPDEERLRALGADGDVRFVGRVEPAELAALRRRRAVALGGALALFGPRGDGGRRAGAGLGPRRPAGARGGAGDPSGGRSHRLGRRALAALARSGPAGPARSRGAGPSAGAVRRGPLLRRAHEGVWRRFPISFRR